MNYGFDTSKWPLVILTIEGAPKDDEEMKKFLEDWGRIYHLSMEKNERYKLLYDVRQAKAVEIRHLVQMGNWLSTMKSLTEKWMDRTAILVSSPTIKLLIQFVFKIYKAVRPFKVFNSPENTIEWLMSEEEGDETNNKFSLNDLNLPHNGKIEFS